MTPRSEALAYRIWAYAEPKGWDVSILELSIALDEHHGHIGRVCSAKDWTHRFRASEGSGAGPFGTSTYHIRGMYNAH